MDSLDRLANDDEVRAYSRALLAELRDEIRHADSKASILLASFGLAVSAVVGGVLAGSWTPFSLADTIEWLWWLGALAFSGGMACLIAAIYPRTRRSAHRLVGLVAIHGSPL